MILSKKTGVFDLWAKLFQSKDGVEMVSLHSRARMVHDIFSSFSVAARARGTCKFERNTYHWLRFSDCFCLLVNKFAGRVSSIEVGRPQPERASRGQPYHITLL